MSKRQVVTLDPWKHRRRIVYSTLIFCAITISYLVFRAPSDSLREQLSLGLVGLAGAVITGYVFGAVTDDYLTRKTKNTEPDDRRKEADV